MGHNFILNKIIYNIYYNCVYNMVFMSMFLSYLSYDIVFFIISYEMVLMRICILVISSGSGFKKDGLLRLIYYTLLGSIFTLLGSIFIIVLIGIVYNRGIKIIIL